MHAPAIDQPRLKSRGKPRVIGLLGFDGVAALDLIGPLEAFKAAQSYRPYNKESNCYRVLLLGLTSRRFVSESGLVFKADELLEAVTQLDTLIVPGGKASRLLEAGAKLAGWLGAHAGRVKRVASINTGLVALAQSGFLDGRQVVTHWRICREVAQRFPRLHVTDTASFVKDGPFYTSGGGTAGMEMTLAMIEEDYGEKVALEVAREFVLSLRPPGAERALIHPRQSEREASERLSELPAWILGHLQERLTVAILAERACVCPRHFSRLFKAVFQTTPAEFVEQLRLGEARRRLSLPGVKIKTVATSVGFKSADSFRRAFERRTGISPSKFRRRSQSIRPRQRDKVKSLLPKMTALGGSRVSCA